MKKLNLGCGNKFHPAWVNVDMYAADDSVLQCNFVDTIPFEANFFDVVYHSHVIEHFTREKGKKLIQECFRILKPGGIIRIAFPDLEKIIKEYQNNIYRLDNNENKAKWDYEWVLLELYDQTVRNENGGAMLKYLNSEEIKNKDYVIYRIGDTANRQKVQGEVCESLKNEIEHLRKQLHKTEQKGISKFIEKLISIKDRLIISLLTKKAKNSFKIGQFRNNGEVHQWMYDRHSIKWLLEETGFTDISIRSASESYIKDWVSYNLDDPQEHSSLFVEAIKPI